MLWFFRRRTLLFPVPIQCLTTYARHSKWADSEARFGNVDDIVAARRSPIYFDNSRRRDVVGHFCPRFGCCVVGGSALVDVVSGSRVFSTQVKEQLSVYHNSYSFRRQRHIGHR